MEYIKYLFVTPWNLMGIQFSLFGFVLDLRILFLLGMFISIIAFVIRTFID